MPVITLHTKEKIKTALVDAMVKAHTSVIHRLRAEGNIDQRNVAPEWVLSGAFADDPGSAQESDVVENVHADRVVLSVIPETGTEDEYITIMLEASLDNRVWHPVYYWNDILLDEVLASSFNRSLPWPSRFPYARFIRFPMIADTPALDYFITWIGK